jgi:hypothetical protein
MIFLVELNNKHYFNMAGEGLKYDTGKLRWDLLPIDCIEDVVKILSFGANKYGPNNWQGIEEDRYYAALMRHLSAYRQGQLIDEESGLSHLAHAMCNVVFLLWFEKHKEDEK